MSAHKWWRLTNISNRINSAAGERSIAEIKFNNVQGVENNNSSKAFANSFLNSNYPPSKAFDSNASTFAHSATENTASGYGWAIGYEFEEPVEVTSVSLQARQDMNPDWGQEWQTASLQCSDDGLTWQNYGLISPLVSKMDLSLVSTIVLTASALNINYIGKNTKYLNIYTVDESGGISGQVQEKGLPIKAEVALHDRLTRKAVAIAWSDNSGNYSFSGLDKNREYYAEALHPTRKFNLVGQDGLRSGMTT